MNLNFKLSRMDFKNMQLKQSMILLGTSVAVMIVMLLSNSYITKLLGREIFGNFSLLISVFVFSQIIFNFGIYQSIGRLIAISGDEVEHREYYATGLLFTLLLFFVMTVSLLIFTFTFGKLKENNLILPMLLCVPLGWVYLLNNFNELLLQGSNKIGLLSQARFLPKVIFLLCVFLLFFFDIKEALIEILLFFFISNVISNIYILYRIKPKFTNQRTIILQVLKANKEFGFNIYIGSMAAVGASSLAGLFISYFGVNNIEVGYFSISTQLCAPLALIPNVIATSNFRKFVNSTHIEKKLLLTMFVISIVSLIVFLLIVKYVILLIYGQEYIDALYMVYYLAIGYVLYGISDFYNRFLLSNGKGKELRNASFIVGLILIVSNLVLINSFGGIGAAISNVIAGLVYLLTIVYYYKQIVNKR